MPGEITQNTGKVRGFHTNVIYYCFVMSLIVYYLLKWNKFSVKKKTWKKYWKMKNNTRKVGTMMLHSVTKLSIIRVAK